MLAQSFCLELVKAVRNSAPVEPFALLDTAHHRVVKEVCVRDAQGLDALADAGLLAGREVDGVRVGGHLPLIVDKLPAATSVETSISALSVDLTQRAGTLGNVHRSADPDKRRIQGEAQSDSARLGVCESTAPSPRD